MWKLAEADDGGPWHLHFILQSRVMQAGVLRSLSLLIYSWGSEDSRRILQFSTFHFKIL